MELSVTWFRRLNPPWPSRLAQAALSRLGTDPSRLEPPLTSSLAPRSGRLGLPAQASWAGQLDEPAGDRLASRESPGGAQGGLSRLEEGSGVLGLGYRAAGKEV